MTVSVVVIEDSVVQRELLLELLAEGSAFTIAGTAGAGGEGIRLVLERRPQLVLTDIGLPDIDGFEVVTRIMAERPTPIVVITGTLQPTWRRDAFEALALGAVEVMEKPAAAQVDDAAWRERFRRELAVIAGSPVLPHVLPRVLMRVDATRRRRRSNDGQTRPEIAVIVGSAGGPKAVRRLLAAIAPAMPLPVPLLVALHLGPGMAASFARWLGDIAGGDVEVIGDQTRLRPGGIYVAPGGEHTTVTAKGVARTGGDVPGAAFQPSLDHLLESVARTYGGSAVGIVLTGMGHDGAKGLLELRRRGGLTAGQDPESCLVYGMPRSAHEAGALLVQGTPESLAQTLSGWLERP